jgi:hypothetical protein
MSSSSHNDRNYLAMLAIPVLLSMVLGFSSNLPANSSLSDRDEVESGLEDSNDAEGQDDSEQNQHKKLAIQNAVEANDYEAFLHATTDTPFGEIMTPDAFTMLVQQYRLQKQGYRPSTYPYLS